MEELQTSTVCCTPGPVRADNSKSHLGQSNAFEISGGKKTRYIDQRVFASDVTFVKVSADLLPLSVVVVKYDASLIHADAAESRFAPKTRAIVCVLQHMVHR